jgi:hypothetical protein
LHPQDAVAVFLADIGDVSAAGFESTSDGANQCIQQFDTSHRVCVLRRGSYSPVS